VDDVTSEIADLREALAQTGRLIDATSPGQAGLPTPCEHWSVRDLVDHIVSELVVLQAMARGEQRRELRGDLSESDWSDQYRRRADETVAFWTERERDRAASGASAHPLLGLTTMEMVIHGWDLAQATGQSAPFDEPLAERVLAFAHGFVRPEGRAASRGAVGGNVPLGPAVQLADGAPALPRLAAFLGRPAGG